MKKIKYIYMVFGVGWGSYIYDWPGLLLTSLRPWSQFKYFLSLMDCV
jgi:hypothetical protein